MDQLMIRVSQHPLISLLTLGTVLSVIWLELLRKRFSIADIQDSLSSFGGITALVVGDTILDEYVYCSGLGASSKDPVLALLCKSRELYAGGAAAVANHVAQHVERVLFCTVGGR